MSSGGILTLDAGGTTFAFTAVHGDGHLSEPLVLKAEPNHLEGCLEVMMEGFSRIRETLTEPLLAISFAFPGPADYPAGVIGDLGNLPAFRGGIPLGPILAQHFGIPVFLENDGNLFTLGEARSGFLADLNRDLATRGQTRRYRHLLGVTLGTGLGGGLVAGGQLITGDNSAAGEIWLLRDPGENNLNLEERVSIRGVCKRYLQQAHAPQNDAISPRTIAEIAAGKHPGDLQAAQSAWDWFGTGLGEALATGLTLLDGCAVLGGGLAAASPWFLPAALKVLRGSIGTQNRLVLDAFNLDDPGEREAFLNPEGGALAAHPRLREQVPWTRRKRIALGTTRLGTARAVALGAWHLARTRLGLEP